MSHAERYRRFVEALRKYAAEGKIKVHITFPEDTPHIRGESLWAVPIGKKYARILNIPFFATHIGQGDIVEIEPGDGLIHEYVKTINHGSYTGAIRYGDEGTDEDIRQRYRTLKDWLVARNISVEGAVAGCAAVAIPTTMSFDEANRLLSECPHVVDYCLDEMEPDPENMDIPNAFDLGLPESFDLGLPDTFGDAD